MKVVTNLGMQLRIAARTLWRNPGFAIAAFVVLSLGIGSVSAIFSVVNKVLLEPLPYPEPERLVELVTSSMYVGDESLASIPKYLIWHDTTTSFQEMAASDADVPEMNLTWGGERKAFKTARVSADYFNLFGAPLAKGRAFSAGEDSPDGARVAIVSYELWRRALHSDLNIVGREIVLDDGSYKVVGVLAADVHLEEAGDIWLPLRADPNSVDLIGRVRVVARLRQGISLEDAEADLGAEDGRPEWQRLLRKYGEGFSIGVSKAIPLREAIVGDVRPSLYILIGAAAFGLAISCLNVATLLLARANQRTREIAIRMAMGATRGRTVFESLTESVLLSAIGGMGGLVFGYLGVRGLLAVSPYELPRVGANGSSITLNWKLALFSVGVSVLVGILCALIPALNASRTNIDVLVKSSGSQSGMTLRRSSWRAGLVIAEVSFSLVLLVGAGLLIRTFVAKRAVNRGFDEKNVVILAMSLNNPRFDTTDQVVDLVYSAEQKMAAVPGVEAIATTSALPLVASVPMPFKVFEQHHLAGKYDGTATWRSVSPQYFKVFRIPLLRGRLFTDDDHKYGVRVALINRAMTKKYWRQTDASPVGDYLSIADGMAPGSRDLPRLIVGVVADVRDAGIDREPAMYIPVAQETDGMTSRNNQILPLIWIIRIDGAKASPVARVQEELSRLSGGEPLARPLTMHAVIAGSSVRAQFYLTVLSIFSGIALVLTAMGIYGLIAYSVQQRGRELAIRTALGAQPFDVQVMVMMQAFRLALWGTLAGIPMALGLARITISLIFGVETWDPVMLGVVALLSCVVALVSAYVPSVRASRVDPAGALRSEV